MIRKKFRDNGLKAWLYLLPAILFLGVFMVYPLIDVFIYSFEEATIRLPRLILELGSIITPMFCMIPTSCRR